MRRIRLVIAAMFTTVIMASACGNGDAVDSGSPIGPDQPAAPPASATPSGPTLVQPKGGTVEPRKVPWTRATPAGDGVMISWSSGVEPCYTLDRVDVKETDTEVTVTLWEGTTDPEAACIQIAIEKETFVKLAKPLAGREVVDGAQ
ncbi:hypothetical protein [Herbidospora cretacea]|uniref:hypothetical protein n=1 Tax=Herbidospora cretacea TaxID=28444 RepID=UPI000774AD8E|nr:hypothetical protein [Herbidospora cretacea]